MSKSESESVLNGSAVKEVALLQQKAQRLDVVQSDEPRGRYYLSYPNGDVKEMHPEQPWVSDTLSSPGELFAYMKNHPGGIAIVTPSEIKYRFAFDRPNANKANVPLITSAAWRLIEQMVGTNYSGAAYGHFDLYRLLRVHLRDCLPPGSDLPRMVRNFRWTTDGLTDSVMAQTSKSLGKSIASNVISIDGEIPESFTVTLNVFDNFTKPMTISIDLDSIPDQQKFRLTPYPGSIESALIKTLDSIRDSFVFDSPVCEAYIGAE